MTNNRRDFLTGSALGVFGFSQLLALAEAQDSGTTAKSSAEVVDFWIDAMGIDPSALPGGKTRGRRPAPGPSTGVDYAREPLFVHYDPDQKKLITADEIPDDKLTPSGDTQVQFQMVRMRLNGDDNKTFQAFTSGGIYVDMQQHSAPSAPGFMATIETMATSAFSAIVPSAGGGGGKGKGKESEGKSGKESGGKSSGKSRGRTASDDSDAAASASVTPSGGAPAAVPLQQPAQAQSLVLPSGAGKTAFLAFAKDRRKTAFGTFLSVFEQLATSNLTSFVPMLSLPVVGTATLSAVRSLVGSLQAHGSDQAWILQSQPLDVAATGAAIKQLPDALKLRAGNYIVIPKSHSDALKPDMDKLAIMDGFLVPQGTKMIDVYDAHQNISPNVTYISLSVGVKASGGAKG